jgi:hypothetical protein
MRKCITAMSVVFLSVCVWAQSPEHAQNQRVPDAPAPSLQQAPSRPANDSSNQDAVVERLEKMVGDQQVEIEKLRQAVEELKSAKSEAPHAPSLGTVASTSPMIPAGKPAEPKELDVSKVPGVVAETPDQQSQVVATATSPESPVSIRYKGVSITPVGFLAAEGVWRKNALNADVNTPFNSIPFANGNQAHINDLFFSGRQSRLGVLVEGKLSMAKLSGYYETDWLSAGVTSNNNQSNSYTNRQRQIWGQMALNDGWSFTGGQMWSLATETKKGLDNRTEALPMVIDAQYHVGFTWARQFGFRIVKNINNKAWLGLSVENPQFASTVVVHGNANNFVLGNLGAGGGLYNTTATYSYNATPDFIVKAAFEPGFGHWEVFGIVRTFQDRVFPNATAAIPSSAGAYNNITPSGGIGANVRGSLAKKHIDVGLHFLGGDGVGRYGTSTLAEATVRPNGEIVAMRNYMGLATLEWHSPRWDWYWYAGQEYATRLFYLNAAGKQVGYGAPTFSNVACFAGEGLPTGATAPAGPCSADTKSLFQGTMGFWYKWYNGPWGRMQSGLQYSYLHRTAWAGVGGGPRANEPMVFASFRYYIP